MGKFALGDTVILTGVNMKEDLEVTVLGVGRKYVRVEWHGRPKAFHLDGSEVGAYSHYSIWTPAEWAETQRRAEVIKRLSQQYGVSFAWNYSNQISTTAMERVLGVLDEEAGE